MGLPLDRTLEILDRVADAIDKASFKGLGEGPFGLYDYTSYGDPIPHHVRDFRSYRSPDYGRSVFRTKDPVEARRYFNDLTRRYIAMAAAQTVLRELGHEFEGSDFLLEPRFLGVRLDEKTPELPLSSPEAGSGDRTPPGSL